MKTSRIFAILVMVSSAFISCTTEEISKAQERTALNIMLSEIIEISESKICTDPDNWSYTAIGSKACGGPTGYIPYSNKIDVDQFLKAVKNYSQAEAKFNEKWGVVSNCTIAQKPIDLICEKNQAKLIYSY